MEVTASIGVDFGKPISSAQSLLNFTSSNMGNRQLMAARNFMIWDAEAVMHADVPARVPFDRSCVKSSGAVNRSFSVELVRLLACLFAFLCPSYRSSGLSVHR